MNWGEPCLHDLRQLPGGLCAVLRLEDLVDLAIGWAYEAPGWGGHILKDLCKAGGELEAERNAGVAGFNPDAVLRPADCDVREVRRHKLSLISSNTIPSLHHG